VPYLSALEVCSRQGAIQIHDVTFTFTFIDARRSALSGRLHVLPTPTIVRKTLS